MISMQVEILPANDLFYSYPAHRACRHPDRTLKKKHNNDLEGWQQRNRIEKCVLCWGNQKEPCGKNPDTRDGNEDQTWVAEPARGLPDFCPSCNSTYRTSQETLLSVPMVLQQFENLISEWAVRDWRDVTESDWRAMHHDKDLTRVQYFKDTRQGPWNHAEGNLRGALSAFQQKWESIIMLAKQDRQQQMLYPG